MANATATLTVNPYPNGVDNTQRRQIVNGTCLLSAGGTYIAGGVPVNWGAIVDGNTNPPGTFSPQVGPWAAKPITALFYSYGGGEATIPPYLYVYDSTNGTLRIMDTATGVELAAAAAIVADKIAFEAEFARAI